jgi:hypothetical protein
MKKDINIKLLIGLGVIALIGVLAYPKIRKKIVEAKIRKAKEKSDKENKEEEVLNPNDINNLIGKIAYPKNEYVNVRSSGLVNNGYRNNFIGKVSKNNPIGKVLSGDLKGDGYVWYRVAVIGKNLNDDKDLGSAKKDATTGFVREDVIIIK